MNKDEALKLALEEIKELVNQYVQIPKHHSSAKTLTILEQALAAQPAPVQEPVCKECDDSGEIETGIGMMACTDCPPAEQRQWVGLTDEEILEAAGIDGADTWLFETAYAIEAKLKEKNT
jgi:uncharacterized UPF0160 family protein